MHDDIEDADERRYGRDTLHVEHGVPVALNAGDLLRWRRVSIARGLRRHRRCVRGAGPDRRRGTS